jgi:hypothetical protein
MKVKLIVVGLLIAALAAVGAGWKWNHAPRKSLGGGQSHLIAGWSWGDMASTGGDVASAGGDVASAGSD